MDWIRRLWSRDHAIRVERRLESITAPESLRITARLRDLREGCRKHGCDRPYHHFAFGHSPFPPPPPVVQALVENASRQGYLPPAGLPELREAIAHFHTRQFGVECAPGQVVISPGGKEMISVVLGAVQGPVLLPVPARASYLPQTQTLRKRLIPVRTARGHEYKLTPDLLEHGLRDVHSTQKILILNQPHDPTGLVYTAEELEGLAEIFRRHRVVVLSDETYALTAFEPERFTSLMRVYPERTIVTGGLSKERSCGGHRLGVGIFPRRAPKLVDEVLKLAGATYSSVATPIQHAALVAYSRDEGIEAHVRDCRAINRLVGTRAADRLAAVAGVETTRPQGAFYLLADCNSYREALARLGIATCSDFCDDVLAAEHVALLPGESLLLPADDFSLRCSFVDYDGAAALARWRENPPRGEEEEDGFVRECCPLVLDGMSNVERYLEQVRRGVRPRHGGALT